MRAPSPIIRRGIPALVDLDISDTLTVAVAAQGLVLKDATRGLATQEVSIMHDVGVAGKGAPHQISVTLAGSDEQAEVKDYVSEVLDRTVLDALAEKFAIGCQLSDTELRAASTLTVSDGVSLRNGFTLVADQDGAVFDGIDFRGKQVIVEADNVTFVNCRFDASVGYTSLIGSAGTAGLTVDLCTFDGLKIDRTFSDLLASYGADAVISNNVFLDAPNDVLRVQGGSVIGNYFAGGGYQADAHSDAIWVPKTVGSLLIENNIIDWRTPADALASTNNAIRITTELGDTSDVTVKDNVLIGGSYTVLVTQGPTFFQAIAQNGTMRNVQVIDNFVDGGYYGALNPYVVLPDDFVYQGNVGFAGAGLPFVSSASDPDLALYPLLAGGASNDVLLASTSPAYIVGGSGQDFIKAGTQGDVIQGGLGRDFITLGVGADILYYKSLVDAQDLVTGFDDASDKIDLAALVELPAGVGNSDWKWLGTAALTGSPLQINYVLRGPDTIVQVDIDGDTLTDFKVQLSGHHTLTMDNFILNRSPASIFASLWTGEAIDAASDTVKLPFDFMSAPFSLKDGRISLVDSDGARFSLTGYQMIVFDDITITTNAEKPIFDNLYYAVTYPDVWSNGADAQTDYFDGGWQAGRNPNAYFSTSGYMAAHADTVTAGGDPLTSYDEIGWRLGNDPSIAFDTDLYLLHNPDVAAAGVNPLEQYLSIGYSQGRLAYAAVGREIQDGFDSEYYLLAHPEVAVSGLSPRQHYDQIGWKLGYDPSAYFSTAYYLANNPDIADAGVNPLQHYMTQGWRDGRDPSSVFDTSAYLAANPDVAASGMNPLLHFLSVGIYEGRNAVATGGEVFGAPPVVAGEVVAGASLGAAASANALTGVLANDSDPDGAHLQVVAVAHSMASVGKTIAGEYGELTLNADGSYSYTLKHVDGPHGQHLRDFFDYVVADRSGNFSSAELEIEINRAPEANDDYLPVSSRGPRSPVSGQNVLANDFDLDGDSLSVVAVAGNGDNVGHAVSGRYGTLTLDADGSYSYRVTTDRSVRTGFDQYTYAISDGQGQTSTSTLTFQIGSNERISAVSSGAFASAAESPADISTASAITGGAGRIFLLNAPGERVITIAGFVSGLDRIVADSNYFSGLSRGDLDPSYLATGAVATALRHAQFVNDTSIDTLLWDMDGTGPYPPGPVADLSVVQPLHYWDFLVV